MLHLLNLTTHSYESGRVTGAGHYAWTSRRIQGKPRMRWLDSIKQAIGLRLDALKKAVQDRKKWRIFVEEKTRNRERTNVKLTQEKAMANHSQTVTLASKIYHRISTDSKDYYYYYLVYYSFTRAHTHHVQNRDKW